MIRRFINNLKRISFERNDTIKFMLGMQLTFSQKSIVAKKLSDIEFKVYSQWGEDGIIQYVINNIPIENKFFIEFGVENYNESNTRFLMMNNNWSGLVIDGDAKNINYIKKRDYFWKYDLTPVNNFITKDNINGLISNQLHQLKVNSNIGLLSVDLDGVDYWVLKEINCIDPSIIICEYNSLFENNIPLTVPYQEDFNRSTKHYSNLYWGANLKAFEELLALKDYIYIGSNMQNLNAFFIKKPLLEKYLPEITNNIDKQELSKFKESRDRKGNLTFLRGNARLREIENLKLTNLKSGTLVKISELFNSKN